VALGLVFFGSGDGHLYAVDAETGELRWKLRTGDVVHGSPAYADGLVVVGSWDGKVYAVDARSGRLRWQFQGGVDPLLHNQQGFQGSPAIAQGLVYIGGRDSHLYALEAASGQERWRFSTGASWVISSPAVHAGRVYFATSDSSLVHALDAASGKPLWQQQGQAFVFSSPTIAGSVLLLGVLNGSLEARDAASGNRLWAWRTDAAQANLGWPLTSDARINGELLYAHGWHDSQTLGAWRQFSVGAVFSTPLVVNQVIYVGSADGRMVAIE
jgi:eukaryotic-like serine/threonine-protein kinase